MAVVSHVGRDEGPLRKLVVLELVIEGREILDQFKASSVLCDGVKKDQRIMLADIVILKSLLIREAETLEARVWHVLLIFGPRDTLSVEKVDDCRDNGRDGIEVIVVHAEGLTTSYSAVIGL